MTAAVDPATLTGARWVAWVACACVACACVAPVRVPQIGEGDAFAAGASDAFAAAITAGHAVPTRCTDVGRGRARRTVTFYRLTMDTPGARAMMPHYRAHAAAERACALATLRRAIAR